MPNTLTIDQVLDFANTVIDTERKANRRDSSMASAHMAGHRACEICGRALKSDNAGTVVGGTMRVGLTCLEKMRKAGLL